MLEVIKVYWILIDFMMIIFIMVGMDWGICWIGIN